VLGAAICVSRVALADGITLKVEAKEPLVLGEIDSALVTISAPETKDTADRPLRVSVNVGRFGPVERQSPGVYTTTYTLPTTRFPQVALVAVWRETGPDAPIAFLRIPLSGRTKLPVKSTKGAEIRVQVGDATFGPVTADRQGRAHLTIAVPPGVTEVVATSSRGRDLSQGTVPVDVPPYNRLTLAVTPYLVPADGESAVTVHAYYDVQTTPPPMEKVRVAFEKGELKPLEQEANRYKYRYVPQRGTQAGEVVLKASIQGDRVSQAEAKLSLGIPIAEKIVSRGTTEPVVADGLSRGAFTVLVLDRLGLGVPKLTLTATSSFARIESVREVGQGEYQVQLDPLDRYPTGGSAMIEVLYARGEKDTLKARFDVPISPAPWPVRAEMTPEPEIPLADGATAFLVSISTFDAAGNAVDGANLRLSPSTPKSATVESLKHDGRGYVARVVPASGADDLELLLTDESGHLRAVSHVSLRSPPKYFGVGAFIGGAYNARPVPTGGLEIDLRPEILDRRLTLYGAVAFREVSQHFTVMGLPVAVDATLQILPISLGATYDVYAGQDLRAYVGAGFELVPFAYRLDTGKLEGTTVRNRFAIGGEIAVGAAWDGFFSQLMTSWANISAEDLATPNPAVMLLLGYRLGIL
jgi:hypothetical protein